MIIDRAWAREFAQEWCDAWTSGDLDRVFSHYVDDFEMRSHLIAERGFSPTGILKGKDAIRPYWGGGIASAKPPLHFILIDAYAGIDNVSIHYRSVGRRFVVETIYFNEQRLGVRASACYGADDVSSTI